MDLARICLPFSSNIKDLSLPDTILPILVILIPVVLDAFWMILARIIQKASKTTGIKITKIGKIVSGKDRSLIFDEKGKQIRAKSKGYIHRF